MIIRHKKTFHFVLECNPELRQALKWGGWGNGYAAVMPGHPLYEMEYNDIYEVCKIDIDSELTYSGYAESLSIPDDIKIPAKAWVIGFDTLHWDDTLERWPKEAVLAEAKKLEKQINDMIL